MKPTILTASGFYFNFIEPKDNQVLVSDIAHALSHICRFSGHTSKFYSVAQHSVMASHIVPPEDALAALFHDAPEAYIGDITSPLKRLLPDYRVIESRLQDDIFTKLGLPLCLPASVKIADRVLLATEQRDLMPKHDDQWACIANVEPLQKRIVPWDCGFAKAMFFDRFLELSRVANS